MFWRHLCGVKLFQVSKHLFLISAQSTTYQSKELTSCHYPPPLPRATCSISTISCPAIAPFHLPGAIGHPSFWVATGQLSGVHPIGCHPSFSKHPHPRTGGADAFSLSRGSVSVKTWPELFRNPLGPEFLSNPRSPRLHHSSHLFSSRPLAVSPVLPLIVAPFLFSCLLHRFFPHFRSHAGRSVYNQRAVISQEYCVCNEAADRCR